MSLRIALAVASAIAALASSPAHAAAPVFAGELGSGAYAGSVAAESGPFTNGAQWSFWKFKADFMANVDITVTPNDASFDPYIAVWYGTETDTANYFDMVSSSLNTTFVSSADGVGLFGPGGAGDPARVSFMNDYGNDYFTLAIADYVDQLGTGQLGYAITAAVPEPETYVQLLAGLGLLAAAMRLRRRAR